MKPEAIWLECMRYYDHGTIIRTRITWKKIPCYKLKYFEVILIIFQFARIHTSSLIKVEKTLNRPTAKFYNDDDTLKRI